MKEDTNYKYTKCKSFIDVIYVIKIFISIFEYNEGLCYSNKSINCGFRDRVC